MNKFVSRKKIFERKQYHFDKHAFTFYYVIMFWLGVDKTSSYYYVLYDSCTIIREKNKIHVKFGLVKSKYS